MRVIAGKARRTELKTVPGIATRPTTDRIKETLFNMIQYEIPDTSFLDLFSGSGAIGIEALSRGAEQACFVENNHEAVSYIKKNLKATRLEEQAEVLEKSVLAALEELQRQKRTFDFVFMDPPYQKEYEKEVLIFLSKSDLIDKDSVVIVEASLDTSLDYCDTLGFAIIKQKKYKTNQHLFLKLKET